MRRYCVVLVALVVVAMATTTLAQAQMVAWNGSAIDASQVPADVPASTEAASGYIPEGPPPADPNWGIQDYVTRTLGAGDFIRRWACIYNGVPNYNNLHDISPDVGETHICVGAPVHLPAGAHLEYVRLIYHDDVSGSVPSMGLYYQDFYTDNTIIGLTPSSYTGGDRYVDFSVDYTIPVKNRSHHVNAIIDRSGSTYHSIYGITFWMHLQISPAPATATFVDVPVGAFGFRQIEALYASGITGGCDATHFCPNASLTRAQMAVFLAKALGLHWDI
ncbi:MAG: S-layer homology domain-containing protein [Acidobacteria bacterium]|nr:S-layer homology domain-containing protein [Acidobacteriota bacterium]